MRKPLASTLHKIFLLLAGEVLAAGELLTVGEVLAAY
jgi:hypothetical protein